MSIPTKKISWLRRLWLRILSVFNTDAAPIEQKVITTPHEEVVSPNIIVTDEVEKPVERIEPMPAAVANEVHVFSRIDIENMTAAEKRRYRKRLFQLHQSRHLNRARS